MADRAEGFRAVATGGVLALSIVGRWASVTLEGELDLSNAHEIPTIARTLAARGVSECVVDLSPVTFVDMSAINALRAANRLLVEHGGRLVLVGLSPLATRMLHVTGLDQGLPAWTPELTRDGDEPAERAGVHQARTPRHGVLDEAMALLAAADDGDTALTTLFRRIARATTLAVPGCTTASCGLVALGAARTAGPSDPLAVELDIAQYELDDGPCLRAIRTGRRATLRDGEPEERAHLTRPGDIEDVCSVPLIFAGHVVGSLNCYGNHRRFSEEAGGYVEALGEASGAALGRALIAARPSTAHSGRPWR